MSTELVNESREERYDALKRDLDTFVTFHPHMAIRGLVEAWDDREAAAAELEVLLGTARLTVRDLRDEVVVENDGCRGFWDVEDALMRAEIDLATLVMWADAIRRGLPEGIERRVAANALCQFAYDYEDHIAAAQKALDAAKPQPVEA
jgi:hypothetical protein